MHRFWVAVSVGTCVLVTGGDAKPQARFLNASGNAGRGDASLTVLNEVDALGARGYGVIEPGDYAGNGRAGPTVATKQRVQRPRRSCFSGLDAWPGTSTERARFVVIGGHMSHVLSFCE